MGTNANWFIALPVDAAALPEGTLAGLPAGLKRLHPADLHVTVAFLSAIGERRALAVWQETDHMQAQAFTVWTGTRAALGHPRRPSAYGLDLNGAPEFTDWLGQWRDRLRAAAGLEPETRSIRPHVTLARPPRRVGAVIHRQAEAWLQQDPPAAVALQLDRVALYTAADNGGERRYQEVRQKVLTGGG